MYIKYLKIFINTHKTFTNINNMSSNTYQFVWKLSDQVLCIIHILDYSG